jgi:peptide/nickel transport system permease protein
MVMPSATRLSSVRRVRLLSSTRRPHLVIWTCVAVVLAVGVAAAFGHLIAPQDPNTQNLLTGTSHPSSSHLLGTDNLGRDILSRVIAGARTAIVGPLIIALGSVLIGGSLGLVAGYLGGRTDWLLMRWVDLMYALPALLIAIVVVGVLGGGYWLSVLLLLLLSAPYDTRVIRGATLEQKGKLYVEAARTLGASSGRIMFWHIRPNITPIMVANSFLNVAFNIVNLAALSFLGLGVAPGTPDWGRMLADNRELVTVNPAAAIAPGVAIVIAAASVNLLGDYVHERLSDRGRAR